MARKTPSRLELRKQVEAAEARDPGGEKKKAAKKRKKATRKKATTRTKRARDKGPARKRLVWGVFSGSMKEEARFPYDQREEAEAKLELLRSKGKRLYFIQPIKEEITEALVDKDAEEPDAVVEPVAEVEVDVEVDTAEVEVPESDEADDVDDDEEVDVDEDEDEDEDDDDED